MTIDFEMLGWVSLNLAFILDSFYYVPQIFRNHRRQEKLDISVTMHFIILTGCVYDCIYGFARHMPWQYQMTALNCVIPILIQYHQLWRSNDHPFLFMRLHWIFTLSLTMIIILMMFTSQPDSIAIALGYIVQFCWLTFLIPQIIKNHSLGHTQSLSNQTFSMMFFISFLDCVNAWHLGYDLSVRYGSVIFMLLECVLIGQILYYRYYPNKTKPMFNQIENLSQAAPIAD